jgi:hypothetical protein
MQRSTDGHELHERHCQGVLGCMYHGHVWLNSANDLKVMFIRRTCVGLGRSGFLGLFFWSRDEE